VRFENNFHSNHVEIAKYCALWGLSTWSLMNFKGYLTLFQASFIEQSMHRRFCSVKKNIFFLQDFQHVQEPPKRLRNTFSKSKNKEGELAGDIATYQWIQTPHFLWFHFLV